MNRDHHDVVSLLEKYIFAEVQEKRNKVIDESTRVPHLKADNIPQQDNGYDCGVFILGYFEEFVKNIDGFIETLVQKGSLTWEIDVRKMRRIWREKIKAECAQYQSTLESKKDMVQQQANSPAEKGARVKSNHGNREKDRSRSRSRDRARSRSRHSSRGKERSHSRDSGDSKAHKAFLERFPNGFTVIEVSGAGNLCGPRALRESIVAQGIHCPVPTVDDLLEILKDSKIQTFETGAGRTNHNNLYIDQLGAILTLWGQKHKLNLQLGYTLADGRKFLVPTPTDTDNAAVVVWISSSSTSGTDEKNMNHYEGLRPEKKRWEY